MFRHLLHSIPRPLTETTQVCHLMVCGIPNVSGVVCRYYGPYELRLSSSLDSSTAVHGCLFRIHHTDACVCLEASQYNSHLVLCSRSACLFDLVLDQLLPYGIYWSAFCHIVWSETGDSLDDRLESNLVLEDQASLELVLSLNSLSCSSNIAIFPVYQLSTSCNFSNKWRKIVCIWEKDTRPFWIMENVIVRSSTLVTQVRTFAQRASFREIWSSITSSGSNL